MTKRKQKSDFAKNFFERTSWREKRVVVGIDEVGRGCLAGPVVTAAVILPFRSSHQLKDSKILTAQKREVAYRWIIRNCWYNVGIVHNRAIDKHNIWQATRIAMKKALINLLATCPQEPEAILVDAMPLDLLDTTFTQIPVHNFPKGEQKSSSIAAASIVAKVTRDALMRSLDRIFPGYLLARHKGYSTKSHKGAIRAEGHSIIHRMSFLENTLQTNEDDHAHQQTICGGD